MPAKKDTLTLGEQQRQELERIAASHKRLLRERTRPRILLLADTKASGQRDAGIAQAVRTYSLMLGRVRRRFLPADLVQRACGQPAPSRSALDDYLCAKLGALYGLC